MPKNENDRKGSTTVTSTTTSPALTAPTTTSPTTLDGERVDLLAALATARQNLITPARGLDDEQAGAHPTVSALCLGGLIKHVASVEEGWMRFVLEGPSAMPCDLPDGVTWADLAAGTAREVPEWAIDHHHGFLMLPGETLAGILTRYEQVAARTEEVLAAVPGLSAAHPLPAAPWHEPGEVRSVRRVLMHVIARPRSTPGTRTSCARRSTGGRRCSRGGRPDRGPSGSRCADDTWMPRDIGTRIPHDIEGSGAIVNKREPRQPGRLPRPRTDDRWNDAHRTDLYRTDDHRSRTHHPDARTPATDERAAT